MLSKKEAIRYVIEHPNGNVSELIAEIGQDRVLEFEYLGYIKNGISDDKESYGATMALRQDYASFYKRHNFLSYIPSYLFGLLAKSFS